VDHHTKCVFNGSDLGKAYSAKMILERTKGGGAGIVAGLAGENKNVRQSGESLQEAGVARARQAEIQLPGISSSAGAVSDYVPYQLKKRKKRKKKQIKF
jgi:hypothetical protein